MMNMAGTLREQVVKLERELKRLSDNKSLQAWIHYQTDERRKALEYWEETARSDDDGLRARRSLAVYHHSQAYDLEIEGRRKESVEHWRAGMKYWAEVFLSKSFRAALPDLSAVQSNQSLDHADLDAIIETLSECVLSPNETLANRAAENKEWKLAGQHVKLIRQSGFAEPVRAAVLDRVLKKICDVFYGRIEHTTLDEHSALSLEDRSKFASEYFPDRINGRLNLLAVAVWRGRKAAETLKDIDAAWARIKELKTRNKLSEIASWPRGEYEQVVKDRLEEVAEAACELELAKLNTLLIRRLKANEEFKSAVRLQSRDKALRAIDDYFDAVGQLQHSDRDAARHLCEELCQRYGGGLKLSALNNSYQKAGESIAEESQSLRTIRSQIRGY
jgi:hypothetical protein